MKRMIFALLLLVVVAMLVIVRSQHKGSSAPPRTVFLSMKDYTFNGGNPTLTFRPGERVRFVVRNDEQSPIRHNFSIPMLNIPCDRELGPGEIRHVTLTMPRSGSFEYLCCTHRGMGGKLVVTGR
jgi:plastocyanin